MQSTHGHLACRYGDLHQELGHVRQKPFECGCGNRGPNQSLDEGRIGRVKGMQIGVRFPLLKQEFYLPSPFVCPTDHLQGVSFGWEVRQKIAEAFAPRGSS